MKIFIDESGVFTKSSTGNVSISCVGALIGSSARHNDIVKKYIKIRDTLPKDKNGEVKGKSLSEVQVSKIIKMLIKHNALFEIAIIDMDVQSNEDLEKGRIILRKNMGSKLSENTKKTMGIENLQSQLDAMSQQLFVQFMLTTQLVKAIIHNIPTYYCQREPKELESIEWTYDAKNKDKITDAESWWKDTVAPFLASISKSDPMCIMMSYGDYSYFDKEYGIEMQDSYDEKKYDKMGVDMGKILSHFNFSSEINYGLELVDILTNSVRRALSGNLQKEGWKDLAELIIHRKDGIPLTVFSEKKSFSGNPSYSSIFHKICSGRKNMLTRRISTLVNQEIKNDSRQQ